MQDSDLVRVLEGVADFGGDPQRVGERQRPLAGEAILQRLALHVSHHVEEDAVGLVGFEQRHDVRMRELGGEQDLALEPTAAEIGAGRGRQSLDRDLSA